LRRFDSGWFGVDRWRPLSLYQRDHGPRDGSDLATWMRAQLNSVGIEAADGKIWLQAFPRVFRLCVQVRSVSGFATIATVICARCWLKCAIPSEIAIAPPERCGQRRRSRLKRNSNAEKCCTCRRFCRVEGAYEFRVRETPNSALVSIDYQDVDGLLIRTALGGRLKPLTRSTALAALLRQPLLTVVSSHELIGRRLRLAIKKAPFYGKHPAPSRTADASTDQAAAGNRPPLRAPYRPIEEIQPWRFQEP